MGSKSDRRNKSGCDRPRSSSSSRPALFPTCCIDYLTNRSGCHQRRIERWSQNGGRASINFFNQTCWEWPRKLRESPRWGGEEGRHLDDPNSTAPLLVPFSKARELFFPPNSQPPSKGRRSRRRRIQSVVTAEDTDVFTLPTPRLPAACHLQASHPRPKGGRSRRLTLSPSPFD